MDSYDTGRRALLTAAAGLVVGPGSSAISAPPPSQPTASNIVPATRSEFAALNRNSGVVWLGEPGREGFFLWQAGDQRALVREDRLQGLYVPANSDPAGATGCWVRLWDGIVGRPEWFGAVVDNPEQDCREALEACVVLCQTVRLGPHDYYIHDSWKMMRSGRAIIGSAGSGSTVGYGVDLRQPMGTADGTRIILCGPKAASEPVFVFGGGIGAVDDEHIMRNSHLRDIKFARDCSRYRVRPSPSNDPVDCVKGVVLNFFSDCTVTGVKSYDSPVGFHCHGIVYSLIHNCGTRRVTPASSKRGDYWTGWLIGGYGKANYGYIGANASVYFEHCSAADSNQAFDTSIGLKLYGRIADTFISSFEMARLDYGIVIDGSDEHGVKMSNGDYTSAHQDVTIINPVLDGYTRGGFLIRNLNDYNCLDIVTPYSAGGGWAVDIVDVAGNVTITGGKLLSGGVRATNVNGFRLMGTLIRDAPVPLELINAGMFKAEPNIFNLVTRAQAGCVLRRAFRGTLAPQVRGAPGKIGYGVTIDAASDHVTIDDSAIDPGSFSQPDAGNKVRFVNKDARLGAGSNRLIGTAG